MNNIAYVNPVLNRPLDIEGSDYDTFSLQQLLEIAKRENIPESEYCNIFVGPRSDYEIHCYYERKKTEQEMKDELVVAQRKIDENRKKKESEKSEKMRKKAERAKFIATLTPEQIELLGIKT